MIKVSDLQAIAGARSRSSMLGKIADAFNKYASRFGVTRKEDIADCLAHICTETGGFRHLSENLNYSEAGLKKTFSYYRKNPKLAKAHAKNAQLIANTAYSDKNRSPRYRLGNTQAGDGWRFRGAGPGQITGRDNFEKFRDATGIDVVSNPELLRDPDTGMMATLLLWERWNMNRYEGGSVASRKKWNGGTHGLKRYQNAYKRAMQRDLRVPDGDYKSVSDKPPSTPTKHPDAPRKATTGILVGIAAIVSAALEKFSGWLSTTLEWIGSLL